MNEMNQQPVKRGPGRPPKPEGEAKRAYFQTRIREPQRQRLDAAAAVNGRSLSEEIEQRLEESLADEDRLVAALGRTYGRQAAAVMLLVGEVLGRAAPHMGFMRSFALEGAEDWLNDPFAFEQAVRAIALILEAIRPEGNP